MLEAHLPGAPAELVQAAVRNSLTAPGHLPVGAGIGQNISSCIKTFLTSPSFTRKDRKSQISNGNQSVVGESEEGVKGNHERLCQVPEWPR